MRLQPLTRRLYGEDQPKQYAALVGSRSLLRQTLDRVGLLIPTDRTLVVSRRHHVRYVTEEFGSTPSPTVLVQPQDRGTAAGVLFPAHRAHWRDSQATLAIFPSDHFVLEEFAFMVHVAETGRQLIPNLYDRLAHIAPFAGTPDEAWAIQQAYALAPKVNFSRACPPCPGCRPSPGATWARPNGCFGPSGGSGSRPRG